MMANESGNFDNVSDEDLAAECGRRPFNENAFAELDRRYRRVIAKHISAKIGLLASTQADDLTQETFLRLFGSLPRYDPSRLRLKAYVHMITDRVIIDFLRYGSLERAHTVAIEDHLRVLEMRAEEDPELLLRVAERLARQIEDPAKVPLVLDLLKGMEVKEVAARHGVKPNQAYAARGRLRDILETISSELLFFSNSAPTDEKSASPYE